MSAPVCPGCQMPALGPDHKSPVGKPGRGDLRLAAEHKITPEFLLAHFEVAKMTTRAVSMFPHNYSSYSRAYSEYRRTGGASAVNGSPKTVKKTVKKLIGIELVFVAFLLFVAFL